MRDEVREGEQIEVKVVNIDPSGKVRLSRKPLLNEGEGMTPRYSSEEKAAKAAHKSAAPPEREGGFGDRGGARVAVAAVVVHAVRGGNSNHT